MKVKAVIMRPDRTNDIYVVPKKKIKGKTFTFNDASYFLHPDRFQVTWVNRLGIKKYYTTYYYKMGQTNPLPVPDFPDITDNGISGEELAAIFNPWFYRIIASQGPTTREQVLFMLVVALCLGMLYLIYAVHQINAPVVP